MRCSADSASHLVTSYVNSINNQIDSIQKNFNDMDFENADAREEAEAIIANMRSKCKNLISELEGYHFLW